MWENTTPSTEFPRDFCAGIGLLQLGIVLVYGSFKTIHCGYINGTRLNMALVQIIDNARTANKYNTIGIEIYYFP